MVYTLLSDYRADSLSGMENIRRDGHTREKKFDFLDQPRFHDPLILYSSEKAAKTILNLPSIHCSACVYLLENLPKIEPAALSVRVDFLRKEASITYDPSLMSLKTLAELLTLIGYEPNLNASLHRDVSSFVIDRRLYLQLGVAGFCAGNMMLFALPDYFAGGELEPFFYTVFNYLNFLLSFAVLYSAGDYLRSAFTAVRERVINMDVPITMGVAVLFFRSAYEVLSGTGTGYFDSLSGLVFFLLLGKIFQKKTYHTLSFERDYRSYFPISVMRMSRLGDAQSGTHVSLDEIKVGDRLLIRHGEIIPADSILMSPSARIDYSFVTGESNAAEALNGERLFAGGKNAGSAIEAEVIRNVSQSYLTQLWNQIGKTGSAKKHLSELSSRFARILTWSVIAVSSAAWLYWQFADPSRAWFIASSVLIIACPCALALALPFTYGAGMRFFGRSGFYLKNANLIELLATIRHIVFDKTGTLTHPHAGTAKYHGDELPEKTWKAVRSLLSQSTHPLSRTILQPMKIIPELLVTGYREIPSQGMEGVVDGMLIRIGSRAWIESVAGQPLSAAENETLSGVYISVDGCPAGYFSVEHAYREGLPEMIASLKNASYRMQVLSGDNDHERAALEKLFGKDTDMFFRQTPFKKIDHIRKMKENGMRVLMTGDGLNDAGALHEADVGIAMTENIGAFTPNSDAILEAASFVKLPMFLSLSFSCVRIVYTGYAVSLLYNVIGITLAVMGYVTPIVSAILMPFSSVSVIALTVGLVKWKTISLKKNFKSLNNAVNIS